MVIDEDTLSTNIKGICDISVTLDGGIGKVSVDVVSPFEFRINENPSTLEIVLGLDIQCGPVRTRAMCENSL